MIAGKVLRVRFNMTLFSSFDFSITSILCGITLGITRRALNCAADKVAVRVAPVRGRVQAVVRRRLGDQVASAVAQPYLDYCARQVSTW